MRNEYHVSIEGNDCWNGSEQSPFRTINYAGSIAVPGDVITVHQGTYREWVKPVCGGESELSRIIYRAAEEEEVIIKGSERIDTWKHYEGKVWKVEVSNAIFGEYNPYAESLYGDWFLMPSDGSAHAGDVYLNGQSFYEAKSLEEVLEGKTSPTANINEDNYIVERLYPEHTKYKWYAEVGMEITTIYANFHGMNPNEELVEINVRKCCFYPDKTGVHYITVRGFEMAHAATPFTPPTADQPGLIGPNWSYGWIIEENVIHDSKCSGISLGKEESTGHNKHARHHIIPGFQGQIESVFRAYNKGWRRESIGSHIVRNNTIYDCGQNGIVGHMGCIFSEIYGNHIYNIGIKYEFFGWEVAGIKFHAPIDVTIKNNYVHHCYLGLWLDWQTQGTRISSNIFCENPRDCVVEVSHGPFLFDNNIMTSETNMSLLAQGGAFVHNLFCGKVNIGKVLDRSTPYHVPHSTDIAGCSLVYGKDDRWYNNIFCDNHQSNDTVEENDAATGADVQVVIGAMNLYDSCPTSLEEYVETVRNMGNEDIEKYVRVEQPAYIDGNVYTDSRRRFVGENHYGIAEFTVEISEKKDGLYLNLKCHNTNEVNHVLQETSTVLHGTKTLGCVRIVNQIYENKNGEPFVIDKDYEGKARNSNPIPGPFEKLYNNDENIKIW